MKPNPYAVSPEEMAEIADQRVIGGRLNIQSGRNLATKVMSNGVEVIVKGDNTNYMGFGYEKTPIISPMLVSPKPITFPPSTVSRQFHLVAHPGKPNVIDHLLHSIVRSATPDMITKTLVTTFTYMTTVLENLSTVVTSREQVISNVVTEKFRPTIEYTPNLKAEPSSIQPFMDESLYSSYFTNTLSTTYTYFNTFTAGSIPVVVTSKETVSNVITMPAYMITPTIGDFSFQSRIFETETYFSTFTFSKTLEDESSRVITTLETITQVVVTEALIPATSPVPQITPTVTTGQAMATTFIDLPKATEIHPTLVDDMTPSQGKPVSLLSPSQLPHTVIDILPEVREPTLSVENLSTNTFETVPLPSPTPLEPSTGNVHTEDHTAVLITSKSLEPVMIFATKTYYTTFTYFTTVLGDGSTKKVQSRTQVASKIVTEALSTAFDIDYVNALKSSYLAKHSTLLEVSSKVTEIIPTKTESATLMEPTLVTQAVYYPHYPKDDDQPGILDPTTPSSGSAEHYEELKEGISHIVHVLADTQSDEYEIVSPSQVRDPLYSTMVTPTIIPAFEVTTKEQEEDYTDSTTEDNSVPELKVQYAYSSMAHKPTPPLRTTKPTESTTEKIEKTTKENREDGTTRRPPIVIKRPTIINNKPQDPFDDPRFSIVTGPPKSVIYDDEHDYRHTTENQGGITDFDDINPEEPVYGDMNIGDISSLVDIYVNSMHNKNKQNTQTQTTTNTEDSLIITPSILNKLDMIGNGGSLVPSISSGSDIFITRVPATLVKSAVSSIDPTQQIFNMLSEITQDGHLPDYYDEMKEHEAFKENFSEETTSKYVYNISAIIPSKSAKPLKTKTSVMKGPLATPTPPTFPTTTEPAMKPLTKPVSEATTPNPTPKVTTPKITTKVTTPKPTPKITTQNPAPKDTTQSPTTVSTPKPTTKETTPRSAPTLPVYKIATQMPTTQTTTTTKVSTYILELFTTPKPTSPTTISSSTNNVQSTTSRSKEADNDSQEITSAARNVTVFLSSRLTTPKPESSEIFKDSYEDSIEEEKKQKNQQDKFSIVSLSDPDDDDSVVVVRLTSKKPDEQKPTIRTTLEPTTQKPRRKPNQKTTKKSKRPPVVDDDDDDEEVHPSVYSLAPLLEEETSGSDEGEDEDLGNDKSEALDSDEALDFPTDRHPPSGPSGPDNTGPSKTSLGAPVGGTGIAANTAGTGSQIVSSSTTGINWTPLLNLGAIGLGGLGASTLTKLGPLWSTMAGYMKSALPLASLARNDTHSNRNERPYNRLPHEEYMQQHEQHPPMYGPPVHGPPFHPMGPNFVKINSGGPPTIMMDSIPRKPILTHANEPNFRPLANRDPEDGIRLENIPRPNNNFPPTNNYNFKPPHDQQPNIYNQLNVNKHGNLPNSGEQIPLANVKIIQGSPINAVHRPGPPASAESAEHRLPRPPPRSQDSPNHVPWRDHPGSRPLPSNIQIEIHSAERLPPPPPTRSQPRPDHNRPYEIIPALLDSQEVASEESLHISSRPISPPNIFSNINEIHKQQIRPVPVKQNEFQSRKPEVSPTQFIRNDNVRKPPIHHMDKVYYNNVELVGSPENPFISVSVEKTESPVPRPTPFSPPTTRLTVSTPEARPSPPAVPPFSAESIEQDSFVPPPPRFPQPNGMHFLPTPPPISRPPPSTNNNQANGPPMNQHPGFPGQVRPVNFEHRPGQFQFPTRLDNSGEKLVPSRPPGVQNFPSQTVTQNIFIPPMNQQTRFQSNPQQPSAETLRPLLPLRPGNSAENFKPGSFEVKNPMNMPPQGALFPNRNPSILQKLNGQQNSGNRFPSPHSSPAPQNPFMPPHPDTSKVQGFGFGNVSAVQKPFIRPNNSNKAYQPFIIRPFNSPNPNQGSQENGPGGPPRPNQMRFPQNNQGSQERPNMNNIPLFMRPRPDMPPPNFGNFHPQQKQPVLIPGSQRIPWPTQEPTSQEHGNSASAEKQSIENHRVPPNYVRPGQNPPQRPSTIFIVRETYDVPTQAPTTTSTESTEAYTTSTTEFPKLIIKEIPSTAQTTRVFPVGGFRNISGLTSTTTTKAPNKAVISKLNFIRRFTTTPKPTSTEEPTSSTENVSKGNSFLLSPAVSDLLNGTDEDQDESKFGGKIPSLESKGPKYTIFPFKSTTRRPFDATKYFTNVAGDNNFGGEISGSEDTESIIDPVNEQVIKSPFDSVRPTSFNTVFNSSTSFPSTAPSTTSSSTPVSEEEKILNSFTLPSGFPTTPKEFNDLWWPTTFKPKPTTSNRTPGNRLPIISSTHKSVDSPTTYRNPLRPTTFRPNGTFDLGNNLIRNQLRRPQNTDVRYNGDTVGMDDVKLKNVEIYKQPEFIKRPPQDDGNQRPPAVGVKGSTEEKQQSGEQQGSEEYSYEVENPEIDIEKDKPRRPLTSDTDQIVNKGASTPPREQSEPPKDEEPEESNETYSDRMPMPSTKLRPPAPPPGYNLDPGNPQLRPMQPGFVHVGPRPGPGQHFGHPSMHRPMFPRPDFMPQPPNAPGPPPHLQNQGIRRPFPPPPRHQQGPGSQLHGPHHLIPLPPVPQPPQQPGGQRPRQPLNPQPSNNLPHRRPLGPVGNGPPFLRNPNLRPGPNRDVPEQTKPTAEPNLDKTNIIRNRPPVIPLRDETTTQSTKSTVNSDEYSEENESNEIIIDAVRSTTPSESSLLVQNQQKSTTEDSSVTKASPKPTTSATDEGSDEYYEDEELSKETDVKQTTPRTETSEPPRVESTSSAPKETEKPQEPSSAERPGQPPNRPIHAGGYLSNQRFHRPNSNFFRPGIPRLPVQHSQQRPQPAPSNQRPFVFTGRPLPPKTEMEPPAFQNGRPRPPVLELPSGGPIRYRPRQPVRQNNLRPNLLRPDDDLFKANKPEHDTPQITLHTIASVDDDNKIVATNVFTAILPSRASILRSRYESAVKPTDILEPSDNIHTTPHPSLEGSESGVSPTSVIKYSSGTLQTVSPVPSSVLTSSEDYESEEEEYEDDHEKPTISLPPIRPTSVPFKPTRKFSRTFIRTVVKSTILKSRFSDHPIAPTPTVDTTSVAQETQAPEATLTPSEVEEVKSSPSASTTSRFVLPSRRPFTRPTLAPVTTESPNEILPAENPTVSSVKVANSRNPFFPVRNGTLSVFPPWRRSTTTTESPSEDVSEATDESNVAQSSTRRYITRRPFVPSLGTKQPTVDREFVRPSGGPTTFRPFRRPGLIGISSTTISPVSSTTEESEETMDDKETSENKQVDVVGLSPAPSSSSTPAAETVQSTEDARSEETRVVTNVQSSVNISPTKAISRGKFRITANNPASSPSLMASNEIYSTRLITHTETETQTITETETTVMSSMGQPLTHTIMITKTLPPQTLISTIVGTVTVVNSVDVKPTTVRTTIFAEPTIIIPSFKETTEHATPDKEAIDRRITSNIITAGGSGRHRPKLPSSTPTSSLTTQASILENQVHIQQPAFECTSTCGFKGNHQVCRKYANGTRSHCVCAPGYARLKPTMSCKPSYTYHMSIAVDKMRGMSFDFKDLNNEGSETYHNFSLVAKEALDRSFLYTDVRSKFMGSEIMKITPKQFKDLKQNVTEDKVAVDFLVQLSFNVSEDLLKTQLIRQLRASNFSVGRTGMITTKNISDFAARDFDECTLADYNDCSKDADCINIKGSYTCECQSGFMDISKSSTPGRECKAVDGCPECNYNGRCIIDKSGNPGCHCFRWFGGVECQINLKILLISIIVIGFVLFILVLLCGIIVCRRKKPIPNLRERTGSGRFLRYRSPTSQATLERTAIMHDSGSSDGSQTPPSRMNPLPHSFTPDSLLMENTDKGLHRNSRDVNLMNFSLRNVIMDQQDRSLTVVIPRAKIRPTSRPSSRPSQSTAMMGPDATADLAASEQKLISYLDQGAFSGQSHRPGAGPSRQSGLQSKPDGKSFRKLSLQEQRKISSGALVSSGTEVSAQGGMRRKSTGLPAHEGDSTFRGSVSEVRSFDETIRSPAKPTSVDQTSRASCYSCKPPSFCAYSESHGHTMAEKDGASTVYTTQGKLFRTSHDSDSNSLSD